MAQAIREYPGDVIAHVDGVAASAATFLTTAAKNTVMAKGSMLMIHNAWTVAAGNADDLLQSAALLEKIDGQIAQDYAARTGVPVEQAKAWMDAETWFTEDEAVNAKLADSVAGEGGEKAMAAWDMRAYAKAPEIKQPEPEKEPEKIEEAANDEGLAHAEAVRRFAIIETAA